MSIPSGVCQTRSSMDFPFICFSARFFHCSIVYFSLLILRPVAKASGPDQSASRHPRGILAEYRGRGGLGQQSAKIRQKYKNTAALGRPGKPKRTELVLHHGKPEGPTRRLPGYSGQSPSFGRTTFWGLLGYAEPNWMERILGHSEPRAHPPFSLCSTQNTQMHDAVSS